MQPLQACCLAAILTGSLVAMVPARADNLYPDPGFELTGELSAAHGGQKAGHLTVGPQSHWGAISTQLTVEPFARYRITEWVKARVTSGTYYAPYCYGWDSYEWAFVTANPIASVQDWTQREATFVSPVNTMYVQPLAYMDSKDSEAWVDDVVVEKLADPAQVMAELTAKPNPTEDEKKLIARWNLAQGNLDAAAALLPRSEGLTHADIATVLAQHTPDLAARRRFVVDVVAYGGPTYNEGVQRFVEITKGMSREEQLQICSEALVRNPGLDRAGRSVRLIIENMLGDSGGPFTVAEADSRLDRMRKALNSALASIPPDSASARELTPALQSVDRLTASLSEQRQGLGHCVVRIGGAAVTPSTHAIIIPDAPSPQETYAARDLQRHLELITGSVIPIRSEKNAGRATPLYVGHCRHAKPVTLRVSFVDLVEEGFHIRTAGPALMLAGNRRGVLYAVYTFLEDNLGCRWFTPDCSTRPKTGTINVPALNRRTLPPLEYRGGDYPIARPGEFAAHSRLNGVNGGESEEQGGKVGVNSLAHTFASLVPPDKYFKDHPEYFSLVNGQRQSGYAQLCLTNPAVLQIVIQGVRRWIKENPTQTVFSVSQNDTDLHCECANCTAVAKAEESQSGPMLRFVNAVADDIRKDYPNVAIETLAYQYTRKPPAITRPRPNVIICLCSIECCFIHPIATDPYNRSFVNDLRGWSKICSRLWIWDYIINYAHSIAPFPNLYVLQPNIAFFQKNGVRGIYEESAYFTKGSEFQELRNYIIAKTLWNPSYSTDQAIDEFCAAYYGAAAPSIRRYINFIHESTQRDPNRHIQIFTHPGQFITPEMIATSRGLFDAAEAAVKSDPVRLKRVEVARLPLLYSEITLARSGLWKEQDGNLVQQSATDVPGLARQFERIARAEGVTMVREGGPDASLDAWLASIPVTPASMPIEQLRNRSLVVDVLPALGGRLWRIQDIAQPQAPRDILLVNGSPDGWMPEDGGYEEYSESGYRSPGWNESYLIREHTDRAITLDKFLDNGLRLTRRIELDPDRPRVTITSTLTNTGLADRTACLRVHPEFRVTSTEHASVRVARPGGGWRVIPLQDAVAPLAEHSVWLKGNDIPAGEWAVVEGDKALVNRFQPSQIGQCLLNWSGAQERANLELYSPERSLAPNGSITVEQSYEVANASVLH